MDCEKFDSHLIDELYDELDEVTHAAMKRHTESCARCSGVLSGLRATREVGILPLVEPSDDLEDRILEAANAAQLKVPWQRKAMRAIAWAGSHAMRPQLAMAAVFMLIIGSSLLLLRAKPGSPGAAPVRVTEHGEPVPESPEQAAAEAKAEPPPAAAAPADRQGQGEGADLPKKEARAAKGSDETTLDGADKDQAATGSASAALSDARAVRSKSGCAAAVPKYDDVGVRFPGTAPAADAMWEAAACYKSMGNTDKARELYLALRGNSAYKDRADAEIALAEAQNQNNYAPGGGAGHAVAGGQKAAAAAAPAPAAPAKPKVAAAQADPASPPAATPPAATGTPGGTGKAPASPTRKQESGL